MKAVHDGIFIRSDQMVTLLSRARYRGDLRLRYEITWRAGDEGGMHAILGGSGYNEGYIFQLGGYGNNLAMILRQHQGRQTVLAETQWSARPGQRYVVECERIDNMFTLRVNGGIILQAADTGEPLSGKGR